LPTEWATKGKDYETVKSVSSHPLLLLRSSV
jgi:hypothetical protein